jgi:hypothetical protein
MQSFPDSRKRVILSSILFLFLACFGSKGYSCACLYTSDGVSQIEFCKQIQADGLSLNDLKPCEGLAPVSQSQISSTRQIKLERKRRKIIEGTPDIVNLQRDLLVIFETRLISFPLTSQNSESVFSNDLIRGPPIQY